MNMTLNFETLSTQLAMADAVYMADLTALNSSGVSGTALFSVTTDGMGGGSVSASIVASGATPAMTHLQHIHGRFDADGTPIDSFTPTIADDADRDGAVEVLEGLGRYGDVLLPLDDVSGASPMADSDGNILFQHSFDIADAANFLSPVTGTQYAFEDVAPFELREYVLHGVDLPMGVGAGTGGEADGTGGYAPILPAAAGEIQQITLQEAQALLMAQEIDSAQLVYLGGRDDAYDARGGQDTVWGGRGDDMIHGGDSADMLFGNAGDDSLYGEAGADTLVGGTGMDAIRAGAGNDVSRGGSGNDMIHGQTGDDALLGNGGNDTVMGDSGNDTLLGASGDDMLGGGSGDDLIGGGTGADIGTGGAGMDTLSGGGEADALRGGADGDLILGQSGDDRLFGDDGNDTMAGGSGDDLMVGGAGNDSLSGGAGDDIFGGVTGNDILRGGAGRDEFHFDAGTGSDRIVDFVQGEDVISLLDDGAVSFANSTEDTVRGDSDLSADDFDIVSGVADLDAANDQQVIYSTGTVSDAMNGTGAAVEAYLAGGNGTDSFLYYDDDWSTTEGRELLATLADVTTALTVSDFDVY